VYIEFTLPQGASGLAAQLANAAISKALIDWAEKYNIVYVKKNIKYAVRVTFEDERLYSHFALTWNPKQNHQLKFRLIEPMKTRQD
jgi:hypothetical protein